MIDACTPPGDRSLPGTQLVPQPDFARQELAPPTVVVARNHEDVDAGVPQIGKGRQRPKVIPGDHGSPFEPEIEQVPVDDERLCVVGEATQEGNEATLELRRSDAEMRVADDVAG